MTVVPDCISQEFLSHYIDEPSEELLTLDITHALAHLLHGVNTEVVTPMLVTFIFLSAGIEISNSGLESTVGVTPGLTQPPLRRGYIHLHYD